MPAERVVVGLDVGGSKTHAILSVDGREVAEVKAGSANLASVGVDAADLQLRAIFSELAGAHSSPARVCAGVAGADTEQARARFAALLAAHVPHARIDVVHDTELLLAAAGVEQGIALIAGTGSVAWGRRDSPAGAGTSAPSREARAGGWGYLLGDEGSGYWVVRAAVRHALDLVDQGRAPDALAQALAAACGVGGPEELLGHFYVRQERRYWAHHSHLVFELAESGDAAAHQIVTDTAAALTELVARVASRLTLPDDAAPAPALPVVAAGGLVVHQPLLQRLIASGLAAHGLRDVRVLENEPVHGAVRLAQRLEMPTDLAEERRKENTCK
nr:BadF/BadG/BcrA/BcrD ATPase family protein [Zhihengliuella flava]